ncbi:MAG TPA: CbtA family protein [Albidovulum sp.]|uniref:CbtA family protein n=1 Tax=Albidovulum sp. TaxID=1872424 RepID=UPI002CC0D3B7|nr:CbtA family protein [Albidovulum sp.]
MTRQIFAGALFAGLVAAALAVVLQMWLLVPLILEAERYESGELVHFAGLANAPEAGGADAQAMAEPAAAEAEISLIERNLMTFSVDFVMFTGYALVLAAFMALRQAAGGAVGVMSGALWGLGAFVALNLAPSVGLPPELPGIPAADLAARKVWWVATVAATGAGLALIAFRPGLWQVAAGVALIALPQIYGAPQTAEFGGIVPPELSAEFAARSLAVAAAQLATLGAVLGYAWTRLAPVARPLTA